MRLFIEVVLVVTLFCAGVLVGQQTCRVAMRECKAVISDAQATALKCQDVLQRMAESRGLERKAL